MRVLDAELQRVYRSKAWTDAAQFVRDANRALAIAERSGPEAEVQRVRVILDEAIAARDALTAAARAAYAEATGTA
jgi:hypothetical protein